VCINYLNSQAAALSLKDEIIADGGMCTVVKANVTVAGDVQTLIERAAPQGRLDILVNNAGPKVVSQPFDRLGWDDMASAYHDIVGSAFAVSQAALPCLKPCKGHIINVLSSAALGRTAYNWLPYVAAKSALHALSKNLAQELGPAGITVNMVSPSLVDTDLVAGTPDRIRQAMIGRTPLRRLATVEDVAGAILMLASPYAQFITGENLLVTGGDIMI
jgi:3-oxoacyl-[acyl-carrier protein] reductase